MILSSIVNELNKYEYTNINILKNNDIKFNIKAKRNGFLVFLKVYKNTKIYSDNFLKEKILNEIKIGEKIGHRNKMLINLNEKYFTNKFIILEYEYLNCLILEILIKNLNNYKLFLLINSIIKALLELKSYNIIQRNLNLKNIFIYKNKIKLGGYSTCIINNHKLMEIKDHKYFVKKYWNNIKYLSPEIITNSYLNYRTPIWNLGIIIYRLITDKYLINMNFLQIKKQLKNKTFKIAYDKSIDSKIIYILNKIFIIDNKMRIDFFSLSNITKYFIEKHKNHNIKFETNDYWFLPSLNIKKSNKSYLNNISFNISSFSKTKFSLNSSLYFNLRNKQLNKSINGDEHKINNLIKDKHLKSVNTKHTTINSINSKPTRKNRAETYTRKNIKNKLFLFN